MKELVFAAKTLGFEANFDVQKFSPPSRETNVANVYVTALPTPAAHDERAQLEACVRHHVTAAERRGTFCRACVVLPPPVEADHPILLDRRIFGTNTGRLSPFG